MRTILLYAYGLILACAIVVTWWVQQLNAHIAHEQFKVRSEYRARQAAIEATGEGVLTDRRSGMQALECGLTQRWRRHGNRNTASAGLGP